MILTVPALKELFSFYSFLIQMIHYINGNTKYIYCCKDIEKRKDEFLKYLYDINYPLEKFDTENKENLIRKEIYILIQNQDTSDKYLKLADLFDEIKKLYMPIIKKYPEYFIPNDSNYCYSFDENENNYMCPFRFEDEEYCAYLDIKDWYILNELKLCFKNQDEKPEEIINYERYIDKFLVFKSQQYFKYIPYGIFIINKYGFEEVKYDKPTLEKLFFEYVDFAKDEYSLKILCYHTFNKSPYKQKAMQVLKKNILYWYDLIENKKIEYDINEYTCVWSIFAVLRRKGEI